MSARLNIHASPDAEIASNVQKPALAAITF
jgi:hypothetical protein